MTDEKSTQNKENTPKPKKDTIRPLVYDIEVVLLQGVKDNAELTKKVLELRKKANALKNSKGKEITEAKIVSLSNAFRRDIRLPRKGKWDKFKDVSKDDLIKIVKK